ncbi:unnamed protein product [Sphagnum compactum]
MISCARIMALSCSIGLCTPAIKTHELTALQSFRKLDIASRGRFARLAPRRGQLQITCVGWDPEGILAPPQPGHIARRSYQRKLEEDVDEKERVEKQMQDERERRRFARENRPVPESHADLVEFFLSTESQEMNFEIARYRPRLQDDFFSHLKSEIGSLRFAVNHTQDVEDRLTELEALDKVLQEGLEAYDRLASDLVGAKDRLTHILVSKDKRATLLEMAGNNELDRPLLGLLDENIAAAAATNNQEQVVEFLKKIRTAVVKYITV